MTGIINKKQHVPHCKSVEASKNQKERTFGCQFSSVMKRARKVHQSLKLEVAWISWPGSHAAGLKVKKFVYRVYNILTYTSINLLACCKQST